MASPPSRYSWVVLEKKKKGPRLILLARHMEKPARSLGEPGHLSHGL